MGFDSELEDSGSDGERDVEGAVGGATGGPGNLGRQPGGVPLLSDPHDHLPIFEDQLLDGLQVLVQNSIYYEITTCLSVPFFKPCVVILMTNYSRCGSIGCSRAQRTDITSTIGRNSPYRRPTLGHNESRYEVSSQ